MPMNVQMMNVRAFNRAVNRHVKNFTQKQLVLAIKKLAMDILRGVVMRTPVDEGTARNNWHVKIGSVGNEYDLELKGGSDSRIESREGPVIENINRLMDFKKTIYIYNNIPYIVYLEDGHSGQAPNGMVKVTLAEVASSFDRRIKFTGYVRRIT